MLVVFLIPFAVCEPTTANVLLGVAGYLFTTFSIEKLITLTK